MTECQHDYSLEEGTVCARCGAKHPMRRRCERLEEDNKELFQEVMTGINDTARLAKENLDLKARDSVRAYERLGGENLGLIERVRELEAIVSGANRRIDELTAEILRIDELTAEPEGSWGTEREDN